MSALARHGLRYGPWYTYVSVRLSRRGAVYCEWSALPGLVGLQYRHSKRLLIISLPKRPRRDVCGPPDRSTSGLGSAKKWKSGSTDFI